MAVEVITLAELALRMTAQEVPTEHTAFVCPCCGTVQSQTSLLRAGAKPGNEADSALGFSCVGRFSKAGEWNGKDPERRKVPGCNWSLGGFLQIHTLAVSMEGRARPAFQLATREQAQRLMARGGDPEPPPPLPELRVGLAARYRDKYGKRRDAEILELLEGGTPQTRPVRLAYRLKPEGPLREAVARHLVNARTLSCYWVEPAESLPPQSEGRTSDP
jgi:hypothetical protein